MCAYSIQAVQWRYFELVEMYILWDPVTLRKLLIVIQLLIGYLSENITLNVLAIDYMEHRLN